MDDFLTVQETAAAADVPEAAVRRWIARGDLTAEERTDGTVVIRELELRRFRFREASRTAVGRAAAEPWPVLGESTVSVGDATFARLADARPPLRLTLGLALAVVAIPLVAVLIRDSGSEQFRLQIVAFAVTLPVAWYGWTLLVSAVRDVRDYRASSGWPAVRGRVVSSREAEVRYRFMSLEMFVATRYYRVPSVTYVYATGDVVYQGDRIAFALGSMLKEDAEEITSFFVSGAEVPVWHHPTDPRRAVLVRYVERSDLIFRLLGGIGLAIGAPIAAIAFSA